MILKKKDEILNWLQQYDSEYKDNIKNDTYEFIALWDSSNQYLIHEMVKKNHLPDDYLEALKLEGHQYIVNVKGDVHISHQNLKIIPLQFYHVDGHFDCSVNQLTSLKGCPEIVGGHFVCYKNQLTSLEYCPQSINGSFDCSNNELISLKGCPLNIMSSFNCSDNHLKSLEFCPSYIPGYFNCSGNKIQSLENCPQYIGDSFDFRDNDVTSLLFFPSHINGFVGLENNQKLLKYKKESNDIKMQKMSDDEFINQYDFSFWNQIHLKEKTKKENEKIMQTIRTEYDQIKLNCIKKI